MQATDRNNCNHYALKIKNTLFSMINSARFRTEMSIFNRHAVCKYANSSILYEKGWGTSANCRSSAQIAKTTISILHFGSMMQIEEKNKERHTYPLASAISLEIFIFLVVPLYNSSRLHGSVLSIGAAFICLFMFIFIGPSAPPKAELKKSSPNKPPLENLIPVGPPLMLLPPMFANGLDEPKNSVKMSLAFLGLKWKVVVCPSAPPGKNEAPPAPGGGTPLFRPSSPYWS
jgi:hypothetical protein